MRAVIFLAFSILLMSPYSLAQQKAAEIKSDEVVGLWAYEVYQVSPIYPAVPDDQVKAFWGHLPHNLKLKNAAFHDAAGVVGHFKKQPASMRKLGIFIYSHTYLVPATQEEIQEMSEQIWKEYNNPVWRKSESDLIAELQLACQKENIALYVNLSGNLLGKWKVLNAPSTVSRTTTPKRGKKN